MLVYLDIPLLKHFIEKAGLKFELRNMKKEEQKYRDPFMSRLLGANKVAVIYKLIEGERKNYVLLGGIWSRIVLGFMPPCELVNMYDYNLKKGLLNSRINAT